MGSAIISGIFGLLGVIVAVVLEEYLHRRWFGRPNSSSGDQPNRRGRSDSRDSGSARTKHLESTSSTGVPNSGRPYEELQAIVEELGGKMRYEKLGRPQGGTWFVSLPEHAEKFFDSNGAGFPPLDRLFVPKVPNPSHYRDYSSDLEPIPKPV